MKNKEYNYGFKIGYYIAKSDISFRLFDLIFEGEFENLRKRIRWLSNIEVRELNGIIISCICSIKKDDCLEKEVSIKKKKEQILKLLR